jgi:hypothetical protein
MDCILARLLMPAHYFNSDSLVRMDNYLCFALSWINPDQAFRRRFSAPEMSQAATSMLHEFLEPSAWTKHSALIAMMRPFLLGGRNGDSLNGWSTAGRNLFTSGVGTADFIGRNHVAFNLTGENLTVDGQLYQQASNYLDFAQAFSSTNFSYGSVHRDLANGLRAYVGKVAEQINQISFGMRRLQEIMDSLGLMAPSRPDGPNHLESMRFQVPIPTMQISALALAADWEQLTLAEMPEDLVYSGQRITEFFGRFASVWQLVKQRTAFPYYTDKTRIDITFEMLNSMGGVPSFAQSLKQVMSDTSATFPFPTEGDSTSNFYKKYEAAERFVDARPEFFGYSNSVVYTNRYLPIQRGEFRRIYEPDMEAVMARVDDQLLLDLAAL